MTTQFYLDDITVDIVRKKIRNMYLRVHAPEGNVRISAPLRMNLEAIKGFARSKEPWIRLHQQRIRTRTQVALAKSANDNTIDIWGVRYPLRLVYDARRSGVALHDGAVVISLRRGETRATLRTVLDRWYTRELQREISPLIKKWESHIGVRVARVSIRYMKTRWGSCSPRSGRIRFNLELAKKRPACLEYVVVHEMVHLLEASHNHRFVAFMDQFMKDWRTHKAELNRDGVQEFGCSPS